MLCIFLIPTALEPKKKRWLARLLVNEDFEFIRNNAMSLLRRGSTGVFLIIVYCCGNPAGTERIIEGIYGLI